MVTRTKGTKAAIGEFILISPSPPGSELQTYRGHVITTTLRLHAEQTKYYVQKKTDLYKRSEILSLVKNSQRN